MNEIILFSLVTIVLGLSFFIALIVGLMKKRKKLILISTGLFILTICFGLYTGFVLVNKSYHKITGLFDSRSGIEVYTALFGQPQSDCIEVDEYQDQVIPKIDYAIWLHFKTCRTELERILAKHPFEKQQSPTAGWSSAGPGGENNWFKPELLGDTILVFQYHEDEFGKGQTIYCNLDSTEVYCVDFGE